MSKPYNQPQDSLGYAIHTARIAKGLTQVQLANAVGVSNKTISIWEINKSRPCKEDLSKIALFTNHDFTKFLPEDISIIINSDNPKINYLVSLAVKLPENQIDLMISLAQELSKKRLSNILPDSNLQVKK